MESTLPTRKLPGQPKRRFRLSRQHRPPGAGKIKTHIKTDQFCSWSVFSVSQKRHAPGGTHFCLLRRTEILPPWYPPFRQNGALRVCEPPCGECAVQRSISLYVSRPSAHVGWTGLFEDLLYVQRFLGGLSKQEFQPRLEGLGLAASPWIRKAR